MFSDTGLYFVLSILSLCSAYFSEASSVRWIPNFEGNITRYRRQLDCGKEKFQCRSGQCIEEDQSCDGKPDCNDDSDETAAACSTFNCPVMLYRFKYGACIAKNKRCNGVQECFDGSDEASCPTPTGAPPILPVTPATNPTLTFVPTLAPPPIECSPRLFKCACGTCISKTLECDGKKDCKDNSDETSPKCKIVTVALNTPPCGNGRFQCRSGQCIEEYDACDGKPDCNDDSDETAAACSTFNCPWLLYRCKYGACVAKNARCNGVQEYFDGSDEASCSRPTGALPVVPVTPATNPTLTFVPTPAPPPVE